MSSLLQYILALRMNRNIILADFTLRGNPDKILYVGYFDSCARYYILVMNR